MEYYRKCIINWVNGLEDFEKLEIIHRFIRRYLS